MGAARGFIISQLSLSSTIPHSYPLSIQQRFRGFDLPPPPSSPGIRHRFSPRRWLTRSLIPPPARFDGIPTRCSLTNANVELNDVASHDEVDEEAFCSSSSCSSALTHLKFDIPEADPLNLLSKRGYIDSALTSLPVLTKEERSTLAATPAHRSGLYALYANCLAGNLVEQLWNFAWPAAIALTHRSILLVAVMSFFTKLAVILGGPLVGRLMDRMPRVPCYNFLSLVQALAQLLSAAMIIHGHTVPSATISHVLTRPWFITLLLAGAVERLTGLALGIAMERDWVVLLAGTNRQIALAQANAVISRIDLLCEILGASFFGVLLSKYDPVTCLKLAAGLMIWSLPVVVSLTWFTNKLSGGVLDRVKCQRASLWQSGSENTVDIGFDSIKHGWVEYLQQPVLPASVAYVLLHFNVVLAPGGLMTAYLVQHGLSSSVIGGFSGLCAFMGVTATFLSAALVKELGILKAGAAGLVFHASLLTVAAAMHWSGYLAHKKALLFFLCLIALSRLGHMSYDVVGSQILQTGIPPSKANVIGTTEVSIASLAEFVMLGVAIVANDVSHFGFLATLSLVSVVGAASTFCGWLLNPTDEQKNLFSFDCPFDSMSSSMLAMDK